MTIDPQISEWSNPAGLSPVTHIFEYGREPGELKHLSSPRKSNQTRYPK